MGIFGRVRSDAYEGGVVTLGACEVEGRDAGDSAVARKLALEADSRGCGVP